MDLNPLLKYVNAYLNGLERGINRAVQAAPLLIRQEFDSVAKRRLNTSRDQYMEALSVEVQNGILLVELDPNDWLANAVESGQSGFDMKPGLLRSDKAKVSKQGYRYAHIPMPQRKTPGGKSENSEFQNKINKVLRDPLIMRVQGRMQQDGSYNTIETIASPTNQPETKGLYRIRKFRNAEAFQNKDSPVSSQFVLFRTVSENPLSKSANGWVHPGIQRRGLFPTVEAWANSLLPSILESIVETEVKKAIKGF